MSHGFVYECHEVLVGLQIFVTSVRFTSILVMVLLVKNMFYIGARLFSSTVSFSPEAFCCMRAARP